MKRYILHSVLIGLCFFGIVGNVWASGNTYQPNETMGKDSACAIVVNGHVVDELGEDVIGATVRVVGTTIVTVTDINGNFTLTTNEGTQISVKYIGYDEATIAAAPEVLVNMKADERSLNEVVVIGYGSIKKDDLTGSVMTLSADDMVTGVPASATDMLVGQAAGVSVTTDGGAPGAGATIRIRGGSSLSASNNPLIVIDGVAIDDGDISGMANPLAAIHPNDIESFTILKDASATAIYGSRASNGVIIITTKKGCEGRARVSYNGSVKVSTKTKQLDVMGADEFRSFVAYKFGEGSTQTAALGTADTDWQKEIYRTAVSTDHNVSVSGSVANIPYRASVGYTSENGIVKTSNMRRLTGSISLNPRFFDNHLSIQLNVKGMYNKNRNADMQAVQMATLMDPTQPVTMDGSKYGNGYFMYVNPTTGVPVDIATTNPVSILNEESDQSTIKRSIGNVQIDYKIHFLPELRVNLNMGYDVAESDGRVIINDNSPMTWSLGNYKQGFGENKDYYQLRRNHLLELYLNYKNRFGQHDIEVMTGYSWQHFYLTEWTLYPYSAAKAQETGNEFYQTETGNRTESYLVSFFGRLNYTLRDKYMLTFTLRDDGSSRFSKRNRWGLFPSLALAWRVNEENILRNVDWLSNLKLRLGYGVTGQQNLNNGDYPYMARYTYSKAGANYFYGNKEYKLLYPLAYDENLKWEETTAWNAGVDFGLWRNKLTGSVDVYYRETNNLLNTVGVAAGTNYRNEILTNVGELKNKGIELTLTAHPITRKDFEWNVSYNLSLNKNEISKLTEKDNPAYKGVQSGEIYGNTGYYILINATGEAYNSFYVFEQIYDENGIPVDGEYVDQNGDNKIDEEDLIVYKKAAPDVYMGLSTQLRYKNWDFSTALRASFGNWVYNNVQSYREAWGGSQMYDPTNFLKNRLQSAWTNNFNNGQFRSSHYIQRADFLRMDNITMGYTLNKLFGENISARFYLTIQNPFVITGYDGIDPEISGTGIDNELYPRPRSYTLGVNVNF